MLVLISVTIISYGQEWLRIFSSNTQLLWSNQLAEDYDHGILIGANRSISTIMKTGWVIKTDINGNTLWEKKFGNGMRMWALDGIDRTPDGGVIIAGVCDTLDFEWWDPFVVKLNACGEVQWCHIFNNENNPDYGIQIKALPDDTYIFLIRDWGSAETHSIWLMHLDVNGEILWKQEYFQNDPLVYPFDARQLSVTQDGKYLITGTCYRPVAGQTQLFWLWPMIIMSDSTGEAVFETAWGHTLPFPEQVGGEGYQSVGTTGGIYTSMCNYYSSAPPTFPTLIKTSLAGDPVSYHDLIPNSSYGKASTLCKLSDSVLLIGTWYQISPSAPNLSVLKTDTLGNIIAEKILNHSEHIPKDAILTNDHKYLITACDLVDNKHLFYLWKLNQNLEWDSIYTMPRVYDSLCPHPITSSTLYFNCDVLVGKEELVTDSAKVRMKVWPNPCRTVLHVALPERIRKHTETEHFTVTTTFHRWNKPLDLEAFDLFGRRLFHRLMEPGEKEVELDVSSWPRGVALLRLSHKGTAVATERVVVEP